MSYFPATVAATLAAREVRYARLVEMDFADGVGRFWEGGTGDLVAGGQTWKGTGELGTISGIESALGGIAPQVKVGLSGIAAQFVAEMVRAETNVKGRDLTIYVQFYDQDWSTLDQPYAVFLGLMDVMSGKTSADKASIELSVESLFARRNRPTWGYLSDRSQKGLYPGDQGLSLVAGMRLAAPFWPVF